MIESEEQITEAKPKPKPKFTAPPTTARGRVLTKAEQRQLAEEEAALKARMSTKEGLEEVMDEEIERIKQKRPETFIDKKAIRGIRKERKEQERLMGKKIIGLTPAEWAEAEALWESGEVTLDDLNKRFGIAATTISRHMTRKGIIKGANAHLHAMAIKEKVLEVALGDSTKLAAKIAEMNDRYVNWYEMLAKMSMSELAVAKKGGKKFETAAGNLKAIGQVLTNIKTCREESWKLYGIDKEKDDGSDNLPELPINDLTEQEIGVLRNAQIKASGGIVEEVQEELSAESYDIIGIDDDPSKGLDDDAAWD